jgi:hypothetical protein
MHPPLGTWKGVGNTGLLQAKDTDSACLEAETLLLNLTLIAVYVLYIFPRQLSAATFH